MSFFSLVLFFIFAIVINIIITSFLLSRAYNSKRIIAEIEETIQSLIANIDSATNKQILIAEENIKALQEEQKNAAKVFKQLKSFRLSRFDSLVSYIEKNKKKNKVVNEARVEQQSKQNTCKDLLASNSQAERKLSQDEIELRRLIKSS